MIAGDVCRYRSGTWDLLYVVLRRTSTKVHILVLENVNNSGYGFKRSDVTNFDIDSPMHQESRRL